MGGADEPDDVLENVAFCPNCDQENDHKMLRTKERGKGVDHLVQCQECGHVQTIELRPPKSMDVRFTLSEGSDSRQIEIEIDDDERFSVGDEFEYGDAIWEVTRLEMSDATSSRNATASEVSMVWAVRRDLVQVRLTFTDGDFSFSDSLICEPDKEFKCGSIFVHDEERWRIRALHSGRGRTLNGSMKARKIRRIFLHMPPSYEDAMEKKTRERGRWRGQEFPGREEHQQKIRESNIRRKFKDEYGD